MGELVGCIEGIGEAARALDFPVVSGNVSLYNETMGAGIPPTPAIGGVGLVDDVARSATLAFKAAGDDILLIGGAPGWLGRSAWLMTRRGPRGGRAAAGRSCRRAPQRRIRRLAHPGEPGQRRPRPLRRRPCGGAGRNGDGGRNWRDVDGRGPRARVLLRRGSGPLHFDLRARPRRRRSPRRRSGSTSRSRASASPAATP